MENGLTKISKNETLKDIAKKTKQKIQLKCNHPKGKVDDKIEISGKEAAKLISKAWAIAV